MRRRTLLAATATGVAGLSGCLGVITGGGGGGSTPAQETLTATDATATTADGAATTATTDGTTPGTEGTAAARDVEFAASVEEITKCGRTCRALFYTVLNRGSDDAAGVGVRIRVFTDGERVYDAVQELGPLDARSKRERIKKQIDVGLSGGAKIRGNDGQVTIELRPEADSGVAETFTFERTLES